METLPADHVGAADEIPPLTHPDRGELDLAAILHALSDPMRLRIVAELAARGDERSCSSFKLPIVKSTCTHHFKVLREAGLIHQQVVGTKRVNSLRRDDIEARFPGLLDAVLQAVPPLDEAAEVSVVEASRSDVGHGGSAIVVGPAGLGHVDVSRAL